MPGAAAGRERARPPPTRSSRRGPGGAWSRSPTPVSRSVQHDAIRRVADRHDGSARIRERDASAQLHERDLRPHVGSWSRGCSTSTRARSGSRPPPDQRFADACQPSTERAISRQRASGPATWTSRARCASQATTARSLDRVAGRSRPCQPIERPPGDRL